MIRVEMTTLGSYRTNTYLLWNEEGRKCCIIDPGYAPEVLLAALEEKHLELEAILLTHGHFDHVGAVKALAADTDCRVFLCEKDLNLPTMLTGDSPLYHTDTYKDGDVVELAGCTIRVVQTPGHTEGSVCLLVGDVMFSGDTLFAGVCGRTDLPGGSEEQMMASLAKLAALPGDYKVLPGHGGSSTLEQERRHNPYMPRA